MKAKKVNPVVWLSALSCIVILGWLLLRPQPDVAFPDKNPRPSVGQATADVELRPAVVPTAPKDHIATKLSPLIVWSKVVPRVGLRTLPFGAWTAMDGRGYTAFNWDSRMGWQGTLEAMGWPPEIADSYSRSMGFAIALDYAIIEHLPIKWSKGRYGYPDEYFPRPTVDEVVIQDADAVEQALIGLLSNGVQGPLKSIPSQYQDLGAEQGLKARALLLLASTSRGQRASEFLASFTDPTSPDINAVAAASLAITGSPEKARGFLLDAGNPRLQELVLASLSNDTAKHWVAVDGEVARGRSGNYTDIARSLDDDIVTLSYTAPEPTVQHAAIVALLPRQDNPKVLAAIIDHLNTAKDPQVIFDLLSAGTLVDSSPPLMAALTRHLESPHKHVRLMTLFRMGNLEDPGVISRVVPFLSSQDANERKVAVMALGSLGRLNPSEAETALRNAAQLHPQDKEFSRQVGIYIKEIQRPAASVRSLTEWAKQNPDHLLR